MPYSYGLEHLNVLSWGEGTTLTVGSFCSIAADVKIFLGGNHRPDRVTTYPFGYVFKDVFPWEETGYPASKGNVVIGNDVWIGSHATILSGVTVGDGAVIGCNSVVTKNVLPYAVVVGNSAREVRKRFSEDQIAALLKLKWWNLPVQRIRELLPLLSSSRIDEFIVALRQGQL